MSIKEILQGKWLGHPLHPALVHVPTGLFPAALIFDLLTFFGPGSPALLFAAQWSLAGGLIFALLAIAPGIADWLEIKPGKRARRLGIWHAGLNVIVLVLMAASLLLRWRDGASDGHVAPLPLVLNLAGNVVLMISGYVGGRMVYEHGISVARLSKKRWRKIAEEGGARLPSES